MKLKSEVKFLLTVRTDAAVRWKNEMTSAILFVATAACELIPLVLFLRLVSFAYFTLLSLLRFGQCSVHMKCDLCASFLLNKIEHSETSEKRNWQRNSVKLRSQRLSNDSSDDKLYPLIELFIIAEEMLKQVVSQSSQGETFVLRTVAVVGLLAGTAFSSNF